MLVLRRLYRSASVANHLWLALVLLVANGASPAAVGAAEPSAPATLEKPAVDAEGVAHAVERAQSRNKLPGVSVAIVRGDTIATSGGAGFADVENEVPARATSVYRIGSISKPVAAVAVMQLVEQGKVSLDDPIQKYVPSFPEKEQGTVTVRHLLTHTAGVRHYKEGEFDSRDRFETLADAIKIFQDDPLLFKPGEKYSYSSYGYNLLAGVVESAAGQPYDAYLQEHIFEPAGMTATFCERAEEIVPHRARHYERATGDTLRNVPYVDLSIKWAGGGLISSAEDLARFDIALREGKLLEPETMEAMYAPTKLADGSESMYGLGWQIRRDDQGRRWVGHSGGATGATTQFLRCPDEKLAVVVLINVRPTPVPARLAQQLAKLVLGDFEFVARND
ncbi:MAG: beta-lactamase family protein [Pirellulales bacterium]|nr:beta-lactamase family protein [Pirellulales bacterium]